MTKGKVGAVIVSAGQSQRMNGINKAFAALAGRPLLTWVLDAFQRCGVVNETVLVLHRDSLDQGQKLLDQYQWSKVVALCQGGARRQDSVQVGLKNLTDCAWVVIHDGARPLVTAEIIERGLEKARQTGAAVAAVPVKDTVKLASPDNLVEYTPQRDTLWSVQTPQVFDFELISQAHQQVSEDVSDDSMMVESLGHRVKLYMGSYENIKVTTPEDLALAEAIVRERECA
ncbi:MAG: 2-C-methyl-D-erythritol 4-phosphate cytidylyltransferase [Chloroflexota bacterium]